MAHESHRTAEGHISLRQAATELGTTYHRLRVCAQATGSCMMDARKRLMIPVSTVDEWRTIGLPCSTTGCIDRAAQQSTLCGRHRERRVWQVGEPRLTSDGYVMVKLADRTISQHRLVMEQMLGRRLTPRENVHHINGDRQDNRPANLELWVRPQSAGQRVSDLVAFVVDEYRDLVLERLDNVEDVAS